MAHRDWNDWNNWQWDPTDNQWKFMGDDAPPVAGAVPQHQLLPQPLGAPCVLQPPLGPGAAAAAALGVGTSSGVAATGAATPAAPVQGASIQELQKKYLDMEHEQNYLVHFDGAGWLCLLCNKYAAETHLTCQLHRDNREVYGAEPSTWDSKSIQRHEELHLTKQQFVQTCIERWRRDGAVVMTSWPSWSLEELASMQHQAQLQQQQQQYQQEQPEHQQLTAGASTVEQLAHQAQQLAQQAEQELQMQRQLAAEMVEKQQVLQQAMRQQQEEQASKLLAAADAVEYASRQQASARAAEAERQNMQSIPRTPRPASPDAFL